MLGQEIKRLIPDYLPHCKTIDGRYKRLTRLGEGRYGKVHLCLDLHFDSLVAMKTLRPGSGQSILRSFMNEVATLAKIASFNAGLKTPRVIDFNFSGTDDLGVNSVYYVMEFIEMGELFVVLDQGSMVSERLACFFFRQLVDALMSLHAHNLVHLDLKPENVLMDTNGNLYLCDFGSAAFIFREEGAKKGGFELPVRGDGHHVGGQLPLLTPSKSLNHTQVHQVTGHADGLRGLTDSTGSKRKKQNQKRAVKLTREQFKCAFLNFSPKEFANFLRNTRFTMTPEYAAPEIVDFTTYQESLVRSKSALPEGDVPNPSKLDVFSLGVLLFFMVLKSLPFGSASLGDEYYKRLVGNRDNFWKIFEKIRGVSKEFKDIISDTLAMANKSRSDLLSLSSHPWVQKHFYSEDQFFRTLAQTNASDRLTSDWTSQVDPRDVSNLSIFSSTEESHAKGEELTLGKQTSTDGQSLIQELKQMIIGRREVLITQITEDLKRKRHRSKSYKATTGLKSGSQLHIHEFIERNKGKLQALRKYLMNDGQESLDSVWSSGSESSSSSGDGR